LKFREGWHGAGFVSRWLANQNTGLLAGQTIIDFSPAISLLACPPVSIIKMISMKKDFDFLTDIAQEFFAKKVIKDTLAAISEFEISGWEKWIQIEFAMFCKSQDNITQRSQRSSPSPQMRTNIRGKALAPPEQFQLSNTPIRYLYLRQNGDVDRLPRYAVKLPGKQMTWARRSTTN
jgi:hypothetical protein